MKIIVASLVMGLVLLMTACADAPTRAAAQKNVPQGLKFTYPTAQRSATW